MRHKILIGQLPRFQDRPSYLQTDLVELIHLLSSIFFYSLFAGLSKLHPRYIASHQSLFLCKKANQGIPQISANYSESQQPQLQHVAAGGSYIPFIFSSKAIILWFIASLSLANEHKATANSSLMTAKLSQMSPCMSQ